jgi:flagella basal body P-ring formation protein FlgA
MAWCARNGWARGRLGALLVLLAGSAAGVCRAGPGTVPRAESALREKLHAAYPGVDRWRIGLLPQQLQASARLAREHIRHPIAIVTRLGPQSAVWVGTSPQSQAPRGAVLWFEVAGYAPALAATHLIPSGASLHPADAALGEHNVLAAGCQAIANPGALRGMRALRLIRAGAVICADAIAPTPPVVRGQEVTARFTAGGVQITARVQAENDGYLGGPVTVRSPRGDALTATVTGKAQVSVND